MKNRILSTILVAVTAITLAFQPNVEIESQTTGVESIDVNEHGYDVSDSWDFGDPGYKTPICIEWEGAYGIRLDGSVKNTLKYAVYSHVADGTMLCKDLKVYKINLDPTCFNRKEKEKDISNSLKLNSDTDDTFRSIDISKLEDGLYKMEATFPSSDWGTHKVSGEFLIQNGKADIVRRNANHYDEFQEFMKQADPKKCLDTSNLCYPTLYNVHRVKELEKISDEIIKHPEWTDKMKVFVIASYIKNHYAYDDYKVDVLNKEKGISSRAKENGGNYDDPMNFCPDNHVGVCWDFTNIFAIMCRHQGIPCTSLENKQHTFNAVYVDEEWYAVDMTPIVDMHCFTKDYSEENWKRYTGGSDWSKLGYYDITMVTYGEELWHYGYSDYLTNYNEKYGG